jgi:oligopeptide transport system ATP-binding protein
MATGLVEAENLSKYFPLSRSRVLKAVDGVSFRIRKGEVLGLVGESGCGKTTIARLVLGLAGPTAGEVTFDGTRLRERSKAEMRSLRRRMQVVFQDPYSSLNPRMTIGNTLRFPLQVHGLYKGEETARVAGLLTRVGLRASDMNRYPHEFSGGQLQRIGIARALSVDPDFIVADEPVSALDVSIQSQVLNLLKDLQEEFHLTCLFIAHDLSVVEFISDRVAVLYLGKIVEIASSEALYRAHRHPYTEMLLSAIPVPDPVVERSKLPFSLAGETSSPINPPPGCRFFSRCPAATGRCSEEEPGLVETDPDHWVACFHTG